MYIDRDGEKYTERKKVGDRKMDAVKEGGSHVARLADRDRGKEG